MKNLQPTKSEHYIAFVFEISILKAEYLVMSKQNKKRKQNAKSQI